MDLFVLPKMTWKQICEIYLVKLFRDLTNRPHRNIGSFLDGKWDPGYFREIFLAH